MMLSCTHNLHMLLLQALLERVLAQRMIFQRFRVAKRVLLGPRKPRKFGCYDYWLCSIRSTPILEPLWPMSAGGLRTVSGLHLEYKAMYYG